MDAISAAIAQFDSQPLTVLSIFIHHATYPLLAFIVVYSLLQRKKVGIKLLVTYALLILFIPTMKALLGFGRACAISKIECPEDAAFPSGHAAASAAALGAAMPTSYFIPALLLHAAVAISRVYLGVHSLSDVIGGTVVGLAAYFAISQLCDEYVWAKTSKGKA